MNTHVFPYRPKIGLKFWGRVSWSMKFMFLDDWIIMNYISNIPIFCNWFIHLITNILYYLAQKAPEFQGSLRVFGQVSWAPRSWFLFIAKWRKPCDLLVRSREDTGIIWETYARLSRIHDSLGANWHDLKKAFFCGKKIPSFWDSKMNQSNIKARFQTIRRHQRNGGYGGCSNHLLWFWTFTEPNIAWGMADSLDRPCLIFSGYGPNLSTFKKPMDLRCFNMFIF